MGPRYTVAEVDVGDSNTNVDRDTAIQIGRLNLRLMLERDAGEGYATIGVARVVERRADNKLVLDTQYIPPMMHAQGNQILDGYVREICGLLHQRGEALAARLSQPGRGGVAEIADFLLLEAVNRSQPAFMQMQQRSVLHPEVSTPRASAWRATSPPSARSAVRRSFPSTCTTTCSAASAP
jgi:type VI secretion system protein ImpJ